MKNKEYAVKRDELCDLYNKAISDFREYFKNKRKIIQSKKLEDDEKIEESKEKPKSE